MQFCRPGPFFLILLIVMSGAFLLIYKSTSQNETLQSETEQIWQRSRKLAKEFYELPKGVNFLDITDNILCSENIKDESKQTILKQNRRIALFTYPSDGLQIKALVSYVPHAQKQKTLVVLRGGNKIFGIPNPAEYPFMLSENYTVLLTTYRGGVSQGTDEYGGDDVNDVKNLVESIPAIAQKIDTPISSDRIYLIGLSRGGMEMFLALERFPEIQSRLAKVVSLSGLLDMRLNIEERSDLKTLYSEEFNYIEGVNSEEWVNRRDPTLAIGSIRKDLPILIIQGTSDIRTKLEHGYHMMGKLTANGNSVKYLEIAGGNHCLRNCPDRDKIIFDWFDQ